MPGYPQTYKRHKVMRGLLCIIALLSVSLNIISCAGTGTSGKIHLTMWYWNRSIDDSLIAQVGKVFPNIDLTAEKITNYDSKVRTSMAGHNGVPDIVAINSNIATYFPDENQFVDLRTLGASGIQSQYLPWKWNWAPLIQGNSLHSRWILGRPHSFIEPTSLRKRVYRPIPKLSRT